MPCSSADSPARSCAHARTNWRMPPSVFEETKMKEKKANVKKANVKKAKKQGTGEAKALDAKVSRKDFEKRLEKLHVEMVELQQWVVKKGLKVCIVFEGR